MKGREQILRLKKSGSRIVIAEESYSFELLINFRRFSENFLEEIRTDSILSEDQEIMKTLVFVKKERNEKLKLRKFNFYDQELKDHIKKLNTRSLLKMLRREQEDYKNNYMTKDWEFDFKDLIKQELNQREHIPNSIESKEIRRKNSKKRTSKSEKENKKIMKKINSLEGKYSLKEIARRLKLKEDFIREIMDE